MGSVWRGLVVGEGIGGAQPERAGVERELDGAVGGDAEAGEEVLEEAECGGGEAGGLVDVGEFAAEGVGGAAGLRGGEGALGEGADFGGAQRWGALAAVAGGRRELSRIPRANVTVLWRQHAALIMRAN